MHIEEACKVIAYWSGYRDAFNPCDTSFEKNPEVNKYLILNNLVPIWESMTNVGFSLRFDQGVWSIDHSYYLIDGVNDEYGREFPNNGKDFAENLVVATALAINELMVG